MAKTAKPDNSIDPIFESETVDQAFDLLIRFAGATEDKAARLIIDDIESSRRISDELGWNWTDEEVLRELRRNVRQWLYEARIGKSAIEYDRRQRSAKGGSATRFESKQNAKLLDDAIKFHGANVSQLVKFLNKTKPDAERPFGRDAVRNELVRRGVIAGK